MSDANVVTYGSCYKNVYIWPGVLFRASTFLAQMNVFWVCAKVELESLLHANSLSPDAFTTGVV